MASAKKIRIQQNDNGIDLVFHLTKDRYVEPIHGAKVWLKFNSTTRENVHMHRECEIVDAEIAEVRYTIVSEDTKDVDVYTVEIEITYANGVILSVDNPFTLIITQETVHTNCDICEVVR